MSVQIWSIDPYIPAFLGGGFTGKQRTSTTPGAVVREKGVDPAEASLQSTAPEKALAYEGRKPGKPGKVIMVKNNAIKMTMMIRR